ncbi:MAG: MotA/TolQ/ExbB proton channel family protein [Planctomycetia bacterium]|nr:MotA/TolQ/ExbB proton channel family protein [Planctomycetia bacterium]
MPHRVFANTLTTVVPRLCCACVVALFFWVLTNAPAWSAPYAQDDSLDLSALSEPEEAPSAPSPAMNALPEEIASPTSTSAPQERQANKFLALVMASGWIGLILLACSLLAVSLIIRLLLQLRLAQLAPQELRDKLTVALDQGNDALATRLAQQSDTLLGRVALSGLGEFDRGWNAVEKSLEDAMERETRSLYRRTEPLSVIGNVAPMLGLLGTVIGMVSTFGQLAVSDGVGRNLANGIYFALVTTVAGLIVAIPVLVAHAWLNARIDALCADASAMVDQVFSTVKRRAFHVAPAPENTATSGVERSHVPQKHDASDQASQPVKPAPGLREVPSNAAPSRPSLTLRPKRNE